MVFLMCAPTELSEENNLLARLCKLKGMHVRENRGTSKTVTCVERQAPEDDASSCCGDVAIKIPVWAWRRSEGLHDTANLFV